jgi:hypothetical protein
MRTKRPTYCLDLSCFENGSYFISGKGFVEKFYPVCYENRTKTHFFVPGALQCVTLLRCEHGGGVRSAIGFSKNCELSLL